MSSSFKKTLLGSGALLLAAFFWGSTFVAQSSAVELLSPFSYLFARSAVGAFALFAVLLLRLLFGGKRQQAPLKTRARALFSKRALLGGALCAPVITAASALQQYGIHLGAGAGEAGFLTSVYMFIVPLLFFIFYRKKVALNVLLGAVLTALGLYFLCLKGEGGLSLGMGQALILACALAYALHILLIARFEDVDPVALSFLQFLFCTLISLILALLFEEVKVGMLLEAWFPIVYAGIFSTAIAYTLQIFGQKHTPPALASILMSCESVIALLCQWLCALLGIFGKPFALSFDQILGCVLAFCGIVCAQLVFKKPKKSKKQQQSR
ncbi:MAG: DMT family transporter [Clostridia bacterium]|nr:DMT family transporter [Clostridia bacterium]